MLRLILISNNKSISLSMPITVYANEKTRKNDFLNKSGRLDDT